MSYKFQDSLQSQIYTTLINDSEILATTNGAIFDAAPSDGDLPEVYIRIGNEYVRDRSSATHQQTEIQFEISVFSKNQGFIKAKILSSQISALMKLDNLHLEHGHLVGVWFQNAQTYRLEKGNLRQIKLWFKAYIDSTQLEGV